MVEYKALTSFYAINVQHHPSKSALTNFLRYLSGRELGSKCPALEIPVSGVSALVDCVSVEVQGAPITVELNKGAAGVGFTLEGGKGSIHGDKPLVINRIFKGDSAYS